MEDAEFQPPGHLSDRAQALWTEFVPSRARSVGRLTLLTVALEAYDRAEAARLVVAADGMTTKTKTTEAVHAHPMLKIERESRQQFAKIWHDLGLHWDQNEDGCNYDIWQQRRERERQGA